MQYTEKTNCGCCAETMTKPHCSFKVGKQRFYFCSNACRDFYSKELEETNELLNY